MTTSAATPARQAVLRRVPPLPGQPVPWPAGSAAQPAVQGTLALDLAGLLPPVATLTAVPAPAEDDEERDSPLRARAARFALAVAEVVVGDRPSSQLLRWVTPAVFDEVSGLAEAAAHRTDADTRSRTERPRLLSVRVYRPSSGAAEVCGHVRHGGRGRALALRLEVRRERWVCTALQLG